MRYRNGECAVFRTMLPIMTATVKCWIQHNGNHREKYRRAAGSQAAGGPRHEPDRACRVLPASRLGRWARCCCKDRRRNTLGMRQRASGACQSPFLPYGGAFPSEGAGRYPRPEIALCRFTADLPRCSISPNLGDRACHLPVRRKRRSMRCQSSRRRVHLCVMRNGRLCLPLARGCGK
jgi:hypothetical protein